MPKSALAELRQRRVEKGLSLDDMARLTGINKGRLSYIERGIAPRWHELTAIMKVLDEPVEPSPTPVG